MKHRFKAIRHSHNQNLFDRLYVTHDATMQAAFAYVGLYVEGDQIVKKLVCSIIDDEHVDNMSFIHDDMMYVIALDSMSSSATV